MGDSGRLGRWALRGLLIVIVLVCLGVNGVVLVQRRESEARGGARCTSNLKQLGLAALQYAQDYDDRLPLWPEAMSKPNRTLFLDQLAGRLTCDEVFRCPESARPGRGRDAARRDLDYGLNRYGRQALAGAEVSRLERPTELILFADANPAGEVWGLGRGVVDEGDWPLTGLAVDRHRAGYNALFCDGHVGWQPNRPNQAMWAVRLR